MKALALSIPALSLATIAVQQSPTFQGAGLLAPQIPNRIAGIPAPEDMVRIEEGTPYTVPDGEYFVLTGVSMSARPFDAGTNTHLASNVSVDVDGIRELTVVLAAGVPGANEANLVEIPPGFAVADGQTVSASEATYSSPSPLGEPSARLDAKAELLGYRFNPNVPAMAIRGIPRADQMIRIQEGTPFVVPEKSRFVLTGILRSTAVLTGFANPDPFSQGTGLLIGNTPSVVSVFRDANPILTATVGGASEATASLELNCLFGGANVSAPFGSPSVQKVPAGTMVTSGSVITVSELSLTSQAQLCGTDIMSFLISIFINEPSATNGVALGYLEESS